MSQVKKYQGGGLYDDVTSRQEANQIRRAANKAERMYRRGQRKAMRQYYNPNEARQARINKLADKIEQQQEIAGIKQGMDEYKDLSAYQDQIETNGPNQNPGDTYGGFMRRPGADYTEQGGGDYFNTQQPHPGSNFIIWNGQKVQWNDFQREQMQKYLNTLDPEDRQFLAGVVDALNDGYDVEYDTNRMALNMPDQYYYVRGKNTVDRLKNEQSRVGAVLGGMFNTKMANYRDSIAQLSKYGLGLQDMDFSEITGLPGEDAINKAWSEGWEANPNYTKMMKRLNDIEGYLKDPETARQVYNELPDDKKWLLEKTYNDPKFYEDLRNAMINGTLSSAQREFLKQIGIVSEETKPAEGPGDDGNDSDNTDDGDDSDNGDDGTDTITDALQKMGITDEGGSSGGYYTPELVDGQVRWNIGDAWGKSQYARLNSYSGFDWGDTYSGGIMLNNNGLGFLISGKGTQWLMDRVDADGKFTFTDADLNRIEDQAVKTEMIDLTTKYKGDAAFRKIVDTALSTARTDQRMRQMMNVYGDLTTIDPATGKVMEATSTNRLLNGIFNYGKRLDEIQEVTRWRNDNQYAGVEQIADVISRSNPQLKLNELDHRDLSAYVKHNDDEIVLGFYDPKNKDGAYDAFGFAIPTKAQHVVKYNKRTRQFIKVNPEDISETPKYKGVTYDKMAFLTPENENDKVTVTDQGHTFKAVKKITSTNGNTFYIGLDTSADNPFYFVWDNNGKPQQIMNRKALKAVFETPDDTIGATLSSLSINDVNAFVTDEDGTSWDTKSRTLLADNIDWNKFYDALGDGFDKNELRDFLLNNEYYSGGGQRQNYATAFGELVNWYISEGLVYRGKQGMKINKFQYGGAVASNATQDIVTTDQKLRGLNDPETFANSISDWKGLSGADKTALIATAGDILSIIPTLTGAGAWVGAGMGMAASAGHLAADIKRDGLDWGDVGRFAGNVGLDILTAIPIAGNVAKVGKLAKVIKNTSKVLIPTLTAMGLSQAAGVVQKVVNDGWKSLTNEDVSVLAGGLTSMRGILKGGRAAIDRARTAKDLNKSKVAANPIENGVTLKPKTGDKVSMNTKAGTTVESGEIKISKDVAEKIAAEKDAAKRRAMIENEVKKSVGDAEWNKMTQREKNDFLSKFESATDGVDFNMPITGRRLSPSQRGAQFNVATSVNGPQKGAGWKAFWDPRKVKIEDVAKKYTDVSEMPEYVKRYLKQEYGKNAALGYGMFYGTPNGKFLGLPGRLGRMGSKHNAQDFNQANLPWRLENNKLKWWQNFGPNRKYSLVNIPKKSETKIAGLLPEHKKVEVAPKAEPKQYKSPFTAGDEIMEMILRRQQQAQLPSSSVVPAGQQKSFDVRHDAFIGPSVPGNNPGSGQRYNAVPLGQTPIQVNKRSQNLFNKYNEIVDANGSIRSDLKLEDLPSDIKSIKPKYLGYGKNETIEQAVKRIVRQRKGKITEEQALQLVLNQYIKFGKTGMKIPKYQEAWAPIPTIEDTNNQWIWSSPNSETLINGEEITDTNANDLNNVTRAPGTVVPFNYDQWLQRSLKPDLPTELLPRQTETITRRKIKRKREPKRDGAGKGAFMENVNWGNLLDGEWLAKSANLIQNLGSARKLYENQKDAINEQAKYRIPNINERYTQFFDDGATSNFMQQTAASRSAISNMAGSDSRANMAMALANEQRIGQEQNNLNRHNAQRYAAWQNTNNQEHKEYDAARYDTFLKNQQRDADLSRALHQAKDNYINQKQQLWNNFGADVITRIQQEKSNKDNVYDTNIWNRLNKQAIAAIKQEFPEYNTANFKPTVEQQQRIQEILNERDALYSAYSHNNRSVFNKMNISKPSLLDESSMNVFKSGGKLSEKDKERIKIDKETAKRFHDLLKLQIRENVKADKEYRKMLNQLWK